MKKKHSIIRSFFHDFPIFLGALWAAICACVFIQMEQQRQSLVPMILVLGVFIVSLCTDGYFWGIVASFISVYVHGYGLTSPLFGTTLEFPEYPEFGFSAAVIFTVAIATSTLTANLKEYEKRRAEYEREHMRANILRAVSHDLRTPLTTIRGSSQVILDNYDTLSREQQLTLLGGIRQDAEWLTRMVENILSITRISGGSVSIRKTPIILEELIGDVLVNFRKHCPDQVVYVEIPEDIVCIPMDAMLIEQVLLNLMENAVHHAVGMTRLELIVTCEEGMAKFCVRDNGCGIPTDRLRNLMSGHADGGGSNTPTDGTRSNMGIGLSVCATIIKAHDSRLHVRNRRGGGLSASFTLPVEAAEETEDMEEINEQQ